MPEKRNLTELLPVIPLRGTVAFPHMIMHFDVAREMSVKAIEEALHGERRVFLVAQEDIFDETPESSDLFEIGVVAEIKQTIKSQDDTVRVLIEGLYRAKFKKMKYQGGMLVAEVRRLPLNSREDYDSLKMDALMRAVKSTYQEYAELFPKMPREILITVMCQSDPMKFYEEIVFNTMLEYKDKQLLLEEGKISERLKMLNDMLARETMVLSMEKEIHDKTQESIDQGQKEYFLREQLRTITNQLHDEFGEDTGERNESYYVERLEEIEMYLPEESSAKLYKEIARLRQMPPASQEAYVVTSYLDTVFDLPWKNLSDDSVDLKKAEASLDADHYGLQKVKERIIESLAVRVRDLLDRIVVPFPEVARVASHHGHPQALRHFCLADGEAAQRNAMGRFFTIIRIAPLLRSATHHKGPATYGDHRERDSVHRVGSTIAIPGHTDITALRG